MARVPESVLHHAWLWQWRLPTVMTTTDGHEITILHPGWLRYTPGPDFQKAQILMDGVLYQGDVEIHIESKDWYRHGHQKDPAYRHVILHAVLTASVPTLNFERLPVPQIELGRYLSMEDLQHLMNLVCDHRPRGPRCAEYRLHRSDEDLLQLLKQMGSGYIVHRSRLMEAEYNNTGLYETLHRKFMRALGYGGYSAFFEQLAKQFPWPLFQSMATETPVELYGRLLEKIRGVHSRSSSAGEKSGPIHPGRPYNQPERRLAWYVAFVGAGGHRNPLEDMMRLAQESLSKNISEKAFKELWASLLLQVRTVHPMFFYNGGRDKHGNSLMGRQRFNTIWWNVFVPAGLMVKSEYNPSLVSLEKLRTGPMERDWIQRLMMRQLNINTENFRINAPLVQLGFHGLFRLICNDLRLSCWHCPLKRNDSPF